MTRFVPLTIIGALGALVLAAAWGPTSAPAAPAGETATFTFTGRGWGHGVGLSQYGARGRSLAGWSAARILGHYYPGTALAAAPSRRVRVLLADGRARIAVGGGAPVRVVGTGTSGRRRVARLARGTAYTLRPVAGGRVSLHRGPRRVVVFRGPVRVQPLARSGVVAWGPRRPEADRRYRGELRVLPAGGRLRLVNVLGLEDYLRGVVPREIPAAWADDAFTAVVAQAVAARSYALATMGRTPTYDVFDDQRSQVYGGVAAEDPRTSRAVARTRATVVTYRGAVITAFFFSTSGGRTESAANVFGPGAARPYLVSVPDRYDRISPLHAWPDRPAFTGQRLARLLGLSAPVTQLAVVRRGASPRVLEARATLADGRTATLSGTTLRSRLGLRDTWFTVTRTPAAATSR
jgi:SpoIID/LytB domain protein